MSAAPPRAPFRGLNALYARTLAVDAGGDELALTYDFAGNILRQELTNDGTDTTALRYTHDAWNRLVKVEFEDEEEDLHPRGEYEYNGLNWRTVARADSDTNNSTHALDELRSMYYSHEWRLLEVRVDANYQSSPGVNSHIQHVWGERYIDDIVSTRLDPDPSVEDGYETVQFHATDAQFSTVAMLSSSAAVLERVTYTAYGVARHHWLSDVDGDGDADTTDVGLVNAAIGKAIGDVGYRSEFDLNRDGSITLADRGLMSAASALPEGVLSSAAVGNRIGYCGYVFAPETRMYLARMRWYLPPLGRWGVRDPMVFIDGMNQYQYCLSAPSQFTDPRGLKSAFPVRRKCVGASIGLPSIGGSGSHAPDPPASKDGGTGPSVRRVGVGLISAQWSVTGALSGECCWECCSSGVENPACAVGGQIEGDISIGFSPYRWATSVAPGVTVDAWLAIYGELGFPFRLTGSLEWGGCDDIPIQGTICGSFGGRGKVEIGGWMEIQVKNRWYDFIMNYGVKAVGVAEARGNLCMSCKGGECCTTFELCGSVSGSVHLSVGFFRVAVEGLRLDACTPKQTLGCFRWRGPDR